MAAQTAVVNHYIFITLGIATSYLPDKRSRINVIE